MNKKVAVILIISILIISAFVASFSGMNNIKNSSQPVAKTNYASIAFSGQDIKNTSNSNIKYSNPLDLNKNFKPISSKNYSNTAISNQYNQTASNVSNAGYVKYTLDLLNNTLLNGNVPNVRNGLDPIGLVFDSANGYIYVSNDGSNTVSVINGTTNTVIDNITVGTYPSGVAYDSANGYIYVSILNSSTVSVINGTTNTVIDDIAVGSEPSGIAYDSANGYIYVANWASNTVSVINGTKNTVIDTITVGLLPYGVAYDPSNGCIYVSNGGSNTVSVINGTTNTVIDTITVGSEPWGIAYDPSNGYIYVSEWLSKNVLVINGATNSVIDTITVGSGPWGIAYDSANGYIYVANELSNNVSVINGATNIVIDDIAVGSGPDGVAYDPSNDYIYVANGGSGTISIISTSAIQLYTVAFTESGLPSGVTWYVNLSNGQSFLSTNSTITFKEPNGSYSYTVATANKNYAESISSGTFTLNGANVQLSVTFSLVAFTVTFIESGLPPETVWSVTLKSFITFNESTQYSSTDEIVFSVPSGTYYYYVSSSTNSFVPAVSFNMGNITQNTVQNVIFLPSKYPSISVGSMPYDVIYDPTNGYIYESNYNQSDVYVFKGTNLISIISTNSYPRKMVYDPATNLIYLLTNSGIDVINTVTNSATLILNGYWFFDLTIDSSGTYIYATGYNNITVINAFNYQIIKTIQLNFQPLNIAYNNQNGYLYVTSSQNYLNTGNVSVINPQTGSILATIVLNYFPQYILFNSINNNVYVTGFVTNTNAAGLNWYSSPGYLSIINEFTLTKQLTVGLAPLWLVNDDLGNIFVSNAESDNITEISGSTNNVIGNFLAGNSPNGIAYNSTGGILYVTDFYSNSLALIQITYPVTYPVEFTESGLSSGTVWTVLLNGKSFNGESINKTLSSSGSTITFNLPNGSYSYSIQGISGYKANNYSGSVMVSGNTINIQITWTVITYPLTITQTGIPNGTEWSVTLTGTAFNGQYINTTLSSTTNTVTFTVPNGTYSYKIHLPSGYQGTNLTGLTSVTGTTANIPIRAQAPTNYMLLIILGIVVVIVIIVAFIAIRMRKPKSKGPEEFKPEEKK